MSIENKFNDLIKDFCKKLSFKYQIPESDLYSVWKDENGDIKDIKDKKSPSKSFTVTDQKGDEKSEKKDEMLDEITREKITSSSTTKDMLTAFCKKKGLKQSGKKEELVARLLESLTMKKLDLTNTKTPKKTEESSVIRGIKDHAGELAIRRNKHGNFEHMATSLVFNTDKLVYGRQQDDGGVVPLTVDDIEICKKYKFPFKLPENLNSVKTNAEIDIEDLDEEELDDEDIEEEELEDEEELGGDEDI